ncbi:MAG: (2Fe-2S)-binding protein [Anaerolineae bacterium]
MNQFPNTQRLPRPPGSAPLTITVDGEPVPAYPGETVATVLLATGRRTFRHTDRFATPRGLFCGMGICYDCLVTVDGQPGARACMTTVQPGMTVETNRRPSGWVSEQGQQEEPHL